MEYDINEVWDGNYGSDIHFEGKIKIDNEVINAIDDEWRAMFYRDLITAQDIAEHIAFNIIVNGSNLSRLDGFANFPDEYAQIVGYEYK